METERNGESSFPVSPISAPMTIPTTPQHGNGSEMDSPLSFRDVFIQNFDVVRGRLLKSEELFKYFISLAHVRIEQERGSIKAASATIERHGLSQMLLASESCIGASVDCLRLNIIKRSQLSRQFVEDVTKEVIDISEKALRNEKKLFSNLDAEGSILSKLLQGEHKAHDEALIHFDNFQRSAFSKVTNTQPVLSPLEHIEAGIACYQSNQSEKIYHEAVFRVNQVRSEYVEKMELILNQLEDLERTRLEFIKDGIDKMFVFELALNRGSQYEIESSFKEIEKYHSQISKEISLFVSRTKPIKPSTLKAGPVKIVTLAEDIIGAKAPSIITPAEVQSVEQKILDSIWEGTNSFTPDELDAIKEALESQAVRLSFCRAVNSKASEIPSLRALQQLGKILNIALDWSEVEMDTETGRRIASFALKFYTIHNERKKFLQSEIYHHSLWNRIQFWEEALATTVADSFITEFVQRIDGHLSFLFVSGLSIDRFGSYLMVFGLNVNSAIDIAKRVMTRDFASLESRMRSSITERLLESVKSAHEKQERNIAILTNLPSPKLSP